MSNYVKDFQKLPVDVKQKRIRFSFELCHKLVETDNKVVYCHSLGFNKMNSYCNVKMLYAYSLNAIEITFTAVKTKKYL